MTVALMVGVGLVAAAPQWLQDLSPWIPILALFAAIVQRLTRLLDKVDTTQHKMDDLSMSVEDTKKMVRHHLGENGDTPAVTDRLARVEEALGLDPPR